MAFIATLGQDFYVLVRTESPVLEADVHQNCVIVFSSLDRFTAFAAAAKVPPTLAPRKVGEFESLVAVLEDAQRRGALWMSIDPPGVTSRAGNIDAGIEELRKTIQKYR